MLDYDGFAFLGLVNTSIDTLSNGSLTTAIDVQLFKKGYYNSTIPI